MSKGKIIKIAGPVMIANGMRGSQMYEVVKVGREELIGEIIELEGGKATIQVYEETAGIEPGEVVEGTGMPLSVELGPGILKGIFDGIQRPLEVIKNETGTFITRGVSVSSLDRKKKWEFKPLSKSKTMVSSGDFLGEVQETDVINHKIMVPPNVKGELIKIASKGKYTLEDVIATVKTSEGNKDLTMLQKWPVRNGRPLKKSKIQ